MKRFLGKIRLSYLPPLMIFFAAGISGFTGIVESFFVKNQLTLSVSALASLAFWAGIPWTFKMPVGHLVDLFWNQKSWFVYFGATLMIMSILIMIGLTGYPAYMNNFWSLNVWYVIASILAPIGFVLQNVVAEAMTVEAVPTARPDGTPFLQEELNDMHVTMQTLGRAAIIAGSTLVAGAGGWLADVLSYKTMYEIALIFPVISVSGVILGAWMKRRQRRQLLARGIEKKTIEKILRTDIEIIKPNWYILILSTAFIVIAIIMGLSGFPGKELIVFGLSLAIIAFLIDQVLKAVGKEKRKEIIAIAIIIFIFRATPSFGAGASWWQIDVLKFNEQFFGTLRQVSSILAIIGMILLRGWIARHSISYFIIVLTVLGTILLLPFIGMFYGLHQWTQAHFGFGAHAIAFIDTAIESPLGEVAMVPMLAWIAKNAPRHQKATYFAVFTAFANLSLSASSLSTEYINNIFQITRNNYSQLGTLMIWVTIINLAAPILAIVIFHPDPK